jgi:hypothetical protein
LFWLIIWQFEFWFLVLQRAAAIALYSSTPNYFPTLASDNNLNMFLVAFNLFAHLILLSIFFASDCLPVFKKKDATKKVSLICVIIYFLAKRIFVLGFGDNNEGFYGDTICVPLLFDCVSRLYMLKAIEFTTIIFLFKYLWSMVWYPGCLIILKSRVKMNIIHDDEEQISTGGTGT